MKQLNKALFILTVFASATAFAVSIPGEIYQPQGQLIKSENKGNEFEIEYHVKGTDVKGLAEKATAHAKSNGFRVVKSDIRTREADLKFVRDNQELDIDIELERDYIEYKADLDNK
ncbi:TPA: hypothetical protein ACK3JJ_000136 [Mannheimia haemolytica]